MALQCAGKLAVCVALRSTLEGKQNSYVRTEIKARELRQASCRIFSFHCSIHSWWKLIQYLQHLATQRLSRKETLTKEWKMQYKGNMLCEVSISVDVYNGSHDLVTVTYIWMIFVIRWYSKL